MRIRIATVTAVLVAFLLAVALPSTASPNDPHFGKQWGMAVIGAESAWSKATGKGILIAVVDTGVDLEHEDLKSKILPGRDFLDPGSSAQDENGHGTHVAGISAAVTFNGKGVAGVAPDAKILPARILNAFGFDVQITLLEQQRAAAAVTWAVDNGAQVINMSFGSVAGSDSDLANAIEYAWSKGVICVIAAGNDDGDSSGYTTENAVIVAATDSSDRLARYSNIVDQAKWGISAPGSSVYSTYFDYPLNQTHNQYASLSGTSMAAPHVSGALAVLRSMGLTPQQAVDRLLASAKDLGQPGSDQTFGAGRLDLAAAVLLPTNAPPGASGSSSVGTGSSGAVRGSTSQTAPKTGTQAKPTTTSSTGPGTGQPGSGETGEKAAARAAKVDVKRRGLGWPNAIAALLVAVAIAIAFLRRRSAE